MITAGLLVLGLGFRVGIRLMLGLGLGRWLGVELGLGDRAGARAGSYEIRRCRGLGLGLALGARARARARARATTLACSSISPSTVLPTCPRYPWVLLRSGSVYGIGHCNCLTRTRLLCQKERVRVSAWVRLRAGIPELSAATG